MTLYRKWSNTTWAGGGWAFADGTYAGATNPGSGDTLKVDSLAGNPGTLSNGATTNRAALYVASDSASNSWYMTPTSAGNQIQFSTGSIDGAVPTTGGRQYALYLEDNKSFGYQGNIGFFTSRNIYVGSGATFYNGFATSSTQACIGSNNAGVSINKYGLGAVKFGTAGGSFVAPYQALSAVNVREGTAIVNGGTTPSPMGNGTFALGYAGNTTTPMLQFVIEHTASRTLSNSIVVESNSIIDIQSGFVPTITGTISGAGTLLIQGGSPLYVSNTVSCPLNMSGSLTMNSTNSITSSSIIGAGTINMNGGTITANAPTFTGSITGLFTYNGTGTMNGNVAGTVRVSTGTPTFTNTSNSGYLEIIDNADVTLNNAFFNGGGFDGGVGYWVYLRGNGNAAIRATVRLVGANAGCNSARRWAPRNNAQIVLTQGATLNSSATTGSIGGFFTDGVEPNPPTPVITSDDVNTNYITTNFYPSGAGTISDHAATNFVAKTGGTLVVTGSLYTNWPGAVGAPASNATGYTDYTFNVEKPYHNSGAPNSEYAGVVRWTGTCFGSRSVLTVGRGTLHINSTSTTALGAGLTVNSGATLACSSTGLYAAQLSGPVTFASGSTFRFGAPA